MSESTFREEVERYPVKPGWVTPTELCHILRIKEIRIKPQRIYNWISKPGSGFPYEMNPDGRKIVPIDDSINWIVAYLQRMAEKEAAKAADAMRKAEAAAAAVGVETIPIIEPEDEWRGWEE